MPGHVTLENARLARAKIPFDNGGLAKLRSIPMGVTWDGRDALFEITSSNIKYVMETFPDITWAEGFNDVFLRIKRKETEKLERTHEKYSKLSLAVDGFDYKTKPYDHQRKGFVLGRDMEGFMYFMEPGTGKSKILVDTVAYLYEKGRIGAVLILAENGLHLEWPAEFAKHIPDRIDNHVITYKSNLIGKELPSSKEAEIDWMVEQDCLRVLCMNIEAMSTDKGKEFALWFVNKQKTLTCVDESQLIGVPGSIRTRNSWSVGKKSAYRRILTGTPVAEGVERVYSQCLFTDFKILETSRYSHFKDRYCQLVGKWNKVVGYKNLDDLNERIDPYSFAVDKADCLDLPPQTFVRRTVELNNEQAKLYKQLKKEYTVEVSEGKWVDAEVAVARLVKLQQIASGFIKFADGEIYTIPETPRLKSLVQLVAQCRHKVIVWCAFKADVVAIEVALAAEGIGSALYWGGISATECKANLDRWRTVQGPKVFLATLKKAVRGLTLNEADNVIYFSHTWSNEARTQSINRNHRIGQDLPVTYYDFVAPGTVDVKILRALEQKENIKKLLSNPKAVIEWLEAS